MHCALVSFAPLLVLMCFFFKAEMSMNFNLWRMVDLNLKNLA